LQLHGGEPLTAKSLGYLLPGLRRDKTINFCQKGKVMVALPFCLCKFDYLN
jgi:hypothetical protein